MERGEMSIKQASVLAALPKPIDEGDYTAAIAPGALSLVLATPEGVVYAQATVALPINLLTLSDAERTAKITTAAKDAARLINLWGEVTKNAERDLRIPVVLDPKTVLTKEDDQ
jgi:hypothetical protein